jgi:hypothetical protein
MCDGRQTYHRGTWKLGLATAEGEKEITHDYKYKADIIWPASCSMAIKLETCKQAGKVEGKAHQRVGTPHSMKNNNRSRAMLTAGSQLKEPLLYGGQGEHSNCLMPTLLAMPHHGPGWGSEQDTDLPGHQRDTHS